ncbi:hypothetical protein ACLB2K_006403 [Fragaria x ananassa]
MKDTASCNVMLMGFVQSGFLYKVLCLVHDMRFAGIQPDTITVIGLIQASLTTKNLDLVKSIHAFGIQIGIERHVSVANTWISAYSKCNDLGSAKAVFDRIDMGMRTVVSWNSMIAGYSNSDKFVDVLNVYRQMSSDGYRPDISTILSILSSCNQPNKLFQGMLIHCHGIQLGCDSDIYVINDLISMYSKCGDIASARFLFDGMRDRTCVSWTSMISRYAENGNMNEALELFHFMEAAGEKPDLVTVLSLVSGCGYTGTLELGKWIHNYALSIGLRDNVVVCNALIDMYAKCGDLNNARELFYALPVRTVVSWTSIISACALNGQSKEALDLFCLMLVTGMKPNHLTFLAILQACTHAGLLEEGMEFFNMMTQDYYMIPRVDHYSCMVNLLGRKRKLKEAVDLVKNMPMKPDAGIWGALLSACRIHSNLEFGEYAFSRLLESEPEVAVPYVEMANIYASERRWDEVATLRKVMKSNKVKKLPGQSFVHVNGKPHVFTVEDRGGHPEALLIYAIIGSLDLQSKDERALLQEQKIQGSTRRNQGIGLEAKTMLSYREDCGDSNITLPYQNDFEVAQSSSTHLSDLTFLGSANEVTVIGCEYSFHFVRGTSKAPPNTNTNTNISLIYASFSSSIGCCSSTIQTIPRGLRSFFTEVERSITGNTHNNRRNDTFIVGYCMETYSLRVKLPKIGRRILFDHSPFGCEARRLVELDAVSKMKASEGIAKTRWEFEHIKNGKGSTPNISVSPVNLILGKSYPYGLGSCFSIMLFVISGVYSSVKKLRFIQLKTNFFKKNGGLLLEQHSASHGDGMTSIYTAEQLQMATDCYQKKLRDKVVEGRVGSFINEIIALAQMNHENLVKFMGCCLETDAPILVYKLTSNGTLFDYINLTNGKVKLSWNVLLKIASESAAALAYIHSSSAGDGSKPTIHGNVKSTNILLTDYFAAKVSGFWPSWLVPANESQMGTCILRTLGYTDPGYLCSGQLTEKSDVYSFGVVLVEILSQEKPISFDRPENGFFRVVDPQLVNKGNQEQVKAVAELAKRCLHMNSAERPLMKEVAEELKRLSGMCPTIV